MHRFRQNEAEALLDSDKQSHMLADREHRDLMLQIANVALSRHKSLSGRGSR